MAKAMINKKTGAKLRLTQAVASPVTAPQTWSLTCNVTPISDAAMNLMGYQQWKQGTATVALELLSHYNPGIGDTAYAEVVAAVKSCKTYTQSALGELSVTQVDSKEPNKLTYCEETQGRYMCSAVTLHGDYVRKLVGFGSDAKSAQLMVGVMMGLSDTRLKAAGIE